MKEIHEIVEQADYITAHRHSSCNRAELEAFDLCGCFYCLETFPTTEIHDWMDELDGCETTAICPRCGIDAVIGIKQESIICMDLLKAMNNYWFENGEKSK